MQATNDQRRLLAITGSKPNNPGKNEPAALEAKDESDERKEENLARLQQYRSLQCQLQRQCRTLPFRARMTPRR